MNGVACEDDLPICTDFSLALFSFEVFVRGRDIKYGK
jgi:hypothetical protein